MKNPSTMFLAKLTLLVLVFAEDVFAQSYQDDSLYNQRQIIYLQEQQLNILQQEQWARDADRREAEKREREDNYIGYMRASRELEEKQKESDSFFRAHCNGVAAMKPKDRANYSKEARKIDPEGRMKCPSEH